VPDSLTQIGKYHIERELGRGGMGVVYRAFDPVVERTLAIKTIRLDVENPGELVERLRREAKSVGQMEHPNIVTLYDAGEAEGMFYLAMQFIQGETLQQRIQRQKWFNWKDTHDLMRQICAGLGYAHQHGIVHRDIKPANIMITPEGVVKLTDFGIAKLVDTGLSSSGIVVGTPSYMSPEQALGKAVDARSDIFSLGSILYELTTSEKAFPGQNATTVIYKIVHESPVPVTALQPGLNPELDAIVLRALAKSPEQRFSSCQELSAALDAYSASVAASVRKTTIMPSPFAQKASPLAEVATPPRSASTSSTIAATPAPQPAAVPQAEALPAPAAPQAQKGRNPLLWLGAGALGAVVIVIAVILAMRTTQPSTTPETTAPAGVSTSVPASEPPEPAPGTSPKKASEIPRPAAETAQPAKPAPEMAAPVPSRAASEARKQPPSATRKHETAAKTNRPQPAPTEQRASIQPGAPGSVGQPETYDGLIVAGDLAFQQGKYQQALDAYKKAYALNPRGDEARRKIVIALTLLGRTAEAQKYQ
jgi:eukaryotic-like serine/threonine-protein kinase